MPTNRHTTSIVDISEIEDEEAAVVAGNGANNIMGREELAANAAAGQQHPAHLYLYHEDLHPQHRIPNLLSSMIGGSAGGSDISPGSTLRPASATGVPAIDYKPQDERNASLLGAGGTGTGGSSTRATTPAGDGSSATPKSANLGTLAGVFFPCVQNIFGVILFIRMVWIVGTAGVPTAFALVFVCCCVTLTTSISLSAIATNGIVPAGGSYFMISRSLGPECGGAVGTMFFLGTTFAGAMYITGAVEIMLNYLAPSWGLFGDFQRDVSILYMNIRVYGTALLAIVGLMVWVGVKFVSKLAPIALFCVLLSIGSIYLGIFLRPHGRDDLMICVLGDRLVTLKNMPYEEPIPNVYNNPYGGQQVAQMQSLAQGNLSLSEFELRRTKSLCTAEKLAYVYCPHLKPITRRPQQQQDLQDQQDSQEQQSGREQQQQDSLEATNNKDLFSKPPNMSNCDPYFSANRHRVHLERAVPGIASGVFFQNLKPRFRSKGNMVSYDDGVKAEGQGDFNSVFVDISTSFVILISIYFPSCTGILAGSNRSGDLADAQRSIPRGTLAAQLSTSFVYLSCIVLFGATFNNLYIRDKFGESMGGQLAVTQIAWPHPTLILVGGLLSTLGAALQSLVGAPRILQGIAKDGVIPCFNRFAKLSARGEPEQAILLTLAIAECAVLIGNLDFIAPILTLSLVMCYFFINLACALHTLLGSPNWRPRFRHYHWSISLLGCFLCLFVMIVSSLANFVLACLLAAGIYKYIEYSGAEKEWGDGKQGLALSAARYNLLRIKTTEPHTKNWRPQVLLFAKLKPAQELEPPSAQAATGSTGGGGGGNLTLNMTSTNLDEDLRVAHPKLLTFASQLKAGKGLTLVSSLIEGDFKQSAGVASRARQSLLEAMQREHVKGFPDALVTPSLLDGLSYQIQTAGLGGLKHNTVVVGWPTHWRRSVAGPRSASENARPPANPADQLRGSLRGQRPAAITGVGVASGGQQQANNENQRRPARTTRAHLFVELMRQVQVSQNALLVVKGVDAWPESCDKLGGYIDIWWIVNDGGLLMLLPHLLRQHRTWRSCQLRVFTVAQAGDNSAQMHEDLQKFLYHLRIEAQVHIVEMHNTEISDYAYERTLMMEQRSEIIKRLNVNRKQSLLLEQEVDGRVIRFRIRKPSIGDFEDEQPSGSSGHQNVPMVDLHPASQQATPMQSPLGGPAANSTSASEQRPTSGNTPLGSVRPDEANVRRMQTALALNEAILKRSRAAKLLIINLPGAPKDSTAEAENNYMEFVEIITDKLERVLLVQNGGREVITIHS